MFKDENKSEAAAGFAEVPRSIYPDALKGCSTQAVQESISGRERVLDRLDVAEDNLIRGLARLRELKQRIRYAGPHDANLVADLVDQFARMNFLTSI